MRAIACAMLWAAAAGAAWAADQRPNVLIVTADNLGYGDLPCFNADSPIRAPHLSRLAAEGARLTDFYTPSSTCTVSRACLLTGRIPARHGLHHQLPGIAGNYGRGLDPAEVLIPQMMRRAGYATGCFGKWNIGFAPGSRPTERGFDEFLGHASGNIDYYTHNYNRKHDLYRGVIEAHLQGYSTDLFADAAIDFIRQHAAKSWFVYLPFNAPHFPNAKNKPPGEPAIWQAPDKAFAAYGYDPKTQDERKRYHAVVTALDSAVGRVLLALDELQLAERTLVFFYSDNGAFMLEKRGLEVSTNAPLRSGGVTCWEGGVRVAALARWPGQIPAGTTVREPLWSPDLFVACSKLSGAELPDVPLDGRDPLPLLTARQEQSPHRSLLFSYRTHAALRRGPWKIVRTREDEPWQLFHLGRDIGETTDLAGSEPQRLKELTEELDRWRHDIAKGHSQAAARRRQLGSAEDPLHTALAPQLRSTVDVVLQQQRTQTKYTDDQFPLPKDRFDSFREEVVSRLAESVGLQQWRVRQPTGKISPLAGRFQDRLLQRLERQGVAMEVHAVHFPESGITVPMVICLPQGEQPVPGVCVFSGHSRHGLRDLVLDLDSYQKGLAVQLARAGLAAIAVEKIDTGYLSRDGASGVDEEELATTLLHRGPVLRSHQLQACLAAAEILAAHPRVDESRIGAAGVSLGGWLSIQTALLSDRIVAVADFGRKTLAIPPDTTAASYQGQRDLCHILPGMLSLCDRNLLALAYCPRPLLAGHGRRDAGSHREGPVHYEQLFRQQYERLGQGRRFQYVTHDGGDDMPAGAAIAWFQSQFNDVSKKTQ